MNKIQINEIKLNGINKALADIEKEEEDIKRILENRFVGLESRVNTIYEIIEEKDKRFQPLKVSLKETRECLD